MTGTERILWTRERVKSLSVVSTRREEMGKDTTQVR